MLLRVRAKRTHAPTPDQNKVGGDTGGVIVVQANDGWPDPLGGGLNVVVCEIVVQLPTLTPLDPVETKVAVPIGAQSTRQSTHKALHRSLQGPKTLIMPSISDGSFHGAGSGRKHGLSMIPAITQPMRSAAASTSRSLT